MCRDMKDSGIEWMGEIPNQWHLDKLKNLYYFEKGKNASLYTQEYIGIHKGKYPVFSGQTENNGIMGTIDTYDYEEDECLFTTTVGAKVMTPRIIKGKFSLSQNCLIMKSNNNSNNKFIYYMLNPLFEYEKSLIPTYMQPSLRVSDLRRYQFYMPSINEQERISNYLDKKVSQIDDIILKQKSLIKKYKAYKQSLITETITKGLNKNIPMKDSGIEWIGKIPCHWNLLKLKFMFTIKKEIANKLGYDILSVTQSGLKVKDISNNEGQISADYSKYQLVDIDDFVMNHMDLLTGFVDCSKFKGVTSPDYRVFKFIENNRNSKRYYNYIFQSCYKNKTFYGLGQGVSNLGRWRLQTDKFMNFVLPVCSLEEQKEIADFLDKKCTAIDSAIDKKEQLIEKLECYKKSLIYECVTGKKGVN